MLTDEVVFVWVGLVVMVVESLRLSGYIFLQSNPLAFTLTAIFNVTMGIMVRNNLFVEIFYGFGVLLPVVCL